jgi:hypothetical protein
LGALVTRIRSGGFRFLQRDPVRQAFDLFIANASRRPTYPAHSGLHDMPNHHNVERQQIEKVPAGTTRHNFDRHTPSILFMFSGRLGRISRLRTTVSTTSSRAKSARISVRISIPNRSDWNAIATLANRRDTLALHAKLDELLRVDRAARSELTQLDEQEPEVIARHRDEEVRKANRELNTAR